MGCYLGLPAIFVLPPLRAAVKFCFLLGKSATETIAMLKTAYGDAALSKTRVYEWFSHFKNGEMSIKDQLRPGRPATSRSDKNVDKNNALIREDRRRTIDQLCEMSGISWSSIQRILSEDLHMRRVSKVAQATGSSIMTTRRSIPLSP